MRRARATALILGFVSGALGCGGGGGDGGPPPDENHSPVAACTASRLQGKAPLAVSFDAGASSDPDGDALSFRWEFGDGETIAGGAVREHLYGAAGAYQVVLTVADGRGGEGTWRATVAVSPPNQAPVAVIAADPVQGPAPLWVSFDASGSTDADGLLAAFAWDFGDGGIAQGLHASHEYAAPGTYTATLTVTDDDGATATTTQAVEVVAANRLPVAACAASPTSGKAPLQVSFDCSASSDPDGDPLAFHWVFGDGFALDAGAVQAHGYAAAGSYAVAVTVSDGRGGSAFWGTAIAVAPPNRPPVAVIAATPDSGTAPLVVSFDASGSSDPDGTIVGYAWEFGDRSGASGVKVTHPYAVQGTFTARLTVTDDEGASGTATVGIQVGAPPLPPEPAAVAPAIDPSVATTVHGSMSFLWSGNSPIQTGVEPGTIDPRRAAVVRGRLLLRDGGAPVPGAAVTVVGHPEYGQTLSRETGKYDLMVNGGGPLTVRFEKQGYLVAQRTVDVPWGDYALVPDVALVPHDPAATLVDLASTAAPFQVARGSEITDDAGTRRATLLVPKGTQARMVFADGTTAPITRMTMRATEFTVGPNGPAAMPAELPPSSGYTYAYELGADEAIAAGAVEVTFDRPQPFYVEDFLGFPVGSAVPTGSYVRSRAAWVAAENGRVLEIVGLDGDAAELDADGDADADGDDDAALATLGVTLDERRELALLYPVAPRRLWRVPIDHFTSPWDHNWPYGPPEGARYPDSTRPRRRGGPERDPCEESGRSVIECQTQVLRESVPIAGTPFRLNYRSDRMPGWKAARTLEVALTGSAVPSGVVAVILYVHVAGQLVAHDSFAPAPNLAHTVEWDGLDGEGRAVRGWQKALVTIGYAYPAVYYSQPSDLQAAFGRVRAPRTGSAAVVPARAQLRVVLQQRFHELLLGAGGAPDAGLGGWSVDPVHALDGSAVTLYRGDGTTSSAEGVPMIAEVAGATSQCPFPETSSCGDGGAAKDAEFFLVQDLAVAPDGAVFVADYQRIRRIDRDGRIRWVGGRHGWWCLPENWPCGDGGAAKDARFSRIPAVAAGPDGALYLTDVGPPWTESHYRVRRIRADGIVEHFAGGGTLGCAEAEGGPADAAAFGYLAGIAVAPDGTVYVADRDAHVVRQIGTDGRVRVLAGRCGVRGSSGDGGLATEALLYQPQDVAVGEDGSVYIVTGVLSAERVRRVRPDGIIEAFAGNGGGGTSGDGGPAIEAGTAYASAIASGSGLLYLVQYLGDPRVRAVLPSGVIVTLAGDGRPCNPGGEGTYARCGDGGLAPAASLLRPVAVAAGQDGSVYVGTQLAVFHVAPPRVVGTGFVASTSADGAEAYVFDASGELHVATQDARQGALRHSFERDAVGRLAAITDAAGNRTVFERDAAGALSAIVGPYGQRTSIGVNADGWLASIVEPSGARSTLEYAPGGLLTRYTSRDGAVHRFGWDEAGRLASDGPEGGVPLTLARVEGAEGFEVRATTAEGLVTVDAVSAPEGLPVVRTRTFPDGTRNVRTFAPDGTIVTTLATGTTTTVRLGADPRFGMLAPVVVAEAVATPGGLAASYAQSRSATIPRGADVLHPSALERTQTVNATAWRTAWQASTSTTTRTLPSGRRSVTVDDALGRPVQFRAPGLEPIAVERDARGRLSRASHGTGAAARSFAFGYDASGRLESVADPLGRTFGLEYGPGALPTAMVRPDGAVTGLGYTAVGDLATVDPPGAARHALRYDGARRLTEYDPPDVPGGGGATLFAYDRDGRLVSIAHPDGRAVAFAWGPGGRLSSTTLGRGTLSWVHDPAGRLSRASAPGVDLEIGYDGGLVRSLAWSGAIAGRVDLGYDPWFVQTSESVNGGLAVAYVHDADGRLTAAGDLAVSRDAATGFVAGTSLGVATDLYAYDGFGALASHAFVAGETRLDLAYTRDALGRIASVEETSGGTTVVRGYAYDAAGRLSAVTVDGAVVASYERDENGNLLSASAGGATVSGAYDAQDRITAWGAATYAHRADGTRSAKREGEVSTTYDYDELGNLLAVVLPGGRRIDYVVDARGRRVGKQVDGKLVRGFLYGDRMRVVAELDGSGAVVSRFVYGTRAHVPDSMVQGGVTYRIVSDHLGSPRLVVDAATGAVAQALDYDALGAVVRDTNPGFQPFGFAGGLRDLDTGLVRLGARDYDPALGRWTAKDPLLFFGGAVNLYAYAFGDPVNGLDVTGLVIDPCDPPDDRCGGGGGGEDGGNGDPRPRRSWEDRLPFNIPNGVDSVVEWVGAVASLLSGTVHFVESAASLNALGSALGVLAWPIAFEDALQTGDQLADRYVTDRLRRMDERVEDLAEEVERGADGDGCP